MANALEGSEFLNQVRDSGSALRVFGTLCLEIYARTNLRHFSVITKYGILRSRSLTITVRNDQEW